MTRTNSGNIGFGKAFRKVAAMSAIVCMAANAGSVTVLAASKAASPPVTVIVDGAKINCAPAPQIENGRILVPVASVLESIGYSVEWDDQFKLAKGRQTAEDGSKRNISISTKALSLAVWEIRPNGDRIQFIVPLDPKDAPLKNVENRLLLPIGVIAQTVGCEVKWDNAARTAAISTKGAKIVPPAGWVQAIEKHYAKYAPDQLAAKQSWADDEAENQRILSGAAKSTAKPAAKAKGVYEVYSERYGKAIEYAFKNPTKPTTAPKVGSVPAKILIDESRPVVSYQNAKGEWIQNLTHEYKEWGAGVIGGCNWYAEARFWDIYGIPFPFFEKFTRSELYLDVADQYDEFTVIRDLKAIRANAMVVFGKGTAANGHVGFIEYVEYDAKGAPAYVYMTEANVNNDTGDYRHGIDGAVTKRSFEDFLNRSKPPIGYIVPNAVFYK